MMTRLLRSTALRLTLAYATVFVVSSFVLVGFLWWRTAAYLDREVAAVIVSDTRAIGDGLRDSGLAGAIEIINRRVDETADEHAIYLLADPTLAVLAGNLAAWPAEIGSDDGWYRVKLARDGRLHAARILHVTLANGFHLLVGRDVQDRAAIRESILDGLAWTAAAAVLLAFAGGLLVRRAVLARVEAINRTASAIVHGDLSKRVATRGTNDEFDELGRTVNNMLQQIQVLIEGVRNASNAVAHDLRTPLAELRGRIEGLLRDRPSRDATFRELEDAIEDLDRLIGVLNALLRLAEIDSGVCFSGFKQVELDRIVRDVTDLYAPLAEAKRIAFSSDAPGGLVVTGDPFLLAQAIGNLVDNAVKYTPAGGSVSLRLRRTDNGSVEVAVSDTGPGIAHSEKSRVAERFYRGEAGRGTSGTGLGLSVVVSVARLHGGALSFADASPGLVATLTLPGTDKNRTPAAASPTDHAGPPALRRP